MCVCVVFVCGVCVYSVCVCVCVCVCNVCVCVCAHTCKCLCYVSSFEMCMYQRCSEQLQVRVMLCTLSIASSTLIGVAVTTCSSNLASPPRMWCGGGGDLTMCRFLDICFLRF